MRRLGLSGCRPRSARWFIRIQTRGRWKHYTQGGSPSCQRACSIDGQYSYPGRAFGGAVLRGPPIVGPS
eukprot:5691958-Lingulodinium_polyedra.AAC.1